MGTLSNSLYIVTIYGLLTFFALKKVASLNYAKWECEDKAGGENDDSLYLCYHYCLKPSAPNPAGPGCFRVNSGSIGDLRGGEMKTDREKHF